MPRISVCVCVRMCSRQVRPFVLECRARPMASVHRVGVTASTYRRGLLHRICIGIYLYSCERSVCIVHDYRRVEDVGRSVTDRPSPARSPRVPPAGVVSGLRSSRHDPRDSNCTRTAMHLRRAPPPPVIQRLASAPARTPRADRPSPGRVRHGSLQRASWVASAAVGTTRAAQTAPTASCCTHSAGTEVRGPAVATSLRECTARSRARTWLAGCPRPSTRAPPARPARLPRLRARRRLPTFPLRERCWRESSGSVGGARGARRPCALGPGCAPIPPSMAAARRSSSTALHLRSLPPSAC